MMSFFRLFSRLLRLAFIVLILFKHGIAWKKPRGQRLRQVLEDLGPIFIKMGQMLSTRRDLLPLDIADELAKLQDAVPPFSSKIAITHVEKALGKPLADVFVTFDAKPIASASIAQVHFATLMVKNKEGIATLREVAVKVLRPNMHKAIDKDVGLMYWMARCVIRFVPDAVRLKPLEVVAEFDKHLHDELDLIKEASNAAQLKRNMKSLSQVVIPEIYWDFCRTNILTMQRMHGVPISQMAVLHQAGVDIKKLATDGVTLFFTQVFRDGFFHADMHPGNILVSIDPNSLGCYILLDFGIVGSLTVTDKEYLAHNFIAFFRRDYHQVAQLHVQSGWVPANTRVEELESAIRSVCEPYFDRPLKEISLGLVLMRLFQTSRRFEVQIQPQLVLLQKTLLNVEGLGRELDPEMDLWLTAQPFLEQWMVDQVGPKKLWRELKYNAPHYAKIVPQLPMLLAGFLEYNSKKSSFLHSGESKNQTSAEKKQATNSQDAILQKLVQAQQRTNTLLHRVFWVGFSLGILVCWLQFSKNLLAFYEQFFNLW